MPQSNETSHLDDLASAEAEERHAEAAQLLQARSLVELADSVLVALDQESGRTPQALHETRPPEASAPGGFFDDKRHCSRPGCAFGGCTAERPSADESRTRGLL